MDWGWRGIFRRALEFVNGSATSVSLPDRARIRYNGEIQDFEESVGGLPYRLLGGQSVAALYQSSWYINPATGSDSNKGSTPGTAIRTFAEYCRRVGSGEVQVLQYIYLLGNISESCRLRASYPQGLVLKGQRTSLYTGQLTGVTSWNYGVTPVTDGTITDAALPGTWSNSGPGGTSLVGKLVVITQGAPERVGMVAWILADLGGKTARVSQFINPLTFFAVPAVPTDRYAVVELTQLRGSTTICGDGSVSGQIDISDIELTYSTAPLSTSSANVILRSCKVDSWSASPSTLWSSFFWSVGSFWDGRLVLYGTQMYLVSSAGSDSRFETFYSQLAAYYVNPIQVLGGGALVNLDKLQIGHGSLVQTNMGAIVVCDLALGFSSAARINAGGQLDVLLGSRFCTLDMAGGYGCRIDSGGSCYWPVGGLAPTFFAFDTAGGGAEFLVGGAADTAAGLAGVGRINAANNAAAVPQS